MQRQKSRWRAGALPPAPTVQLCTRMSPTSSWNCRRDVNSCVAFKEFPERLRDSVATSICAAEQRFSVKHGRAGPSAAFLSFAPTAPGPF